MKAAEGKESDPEKEQAFSDAFYSAVENRYADAAESLSAIGDDAKELLKQAGKMSTAGFSIRHMTIHSKGEKQVDHDLRVIFETGAAAVESLRIQYYFLTDKGKLYAGHEDFKEPGSFSDYRCAASVSGEMLNSQKLINARAELYLYGNLVSEKNLKTSEKKWWLSSERENVLFYDSGESGWVSSALKIKARGSVKPMRK